MDIRLTPARPTGTAAAPASKSMAHRALLCACLAGGTGTVHNIGSSVDITATIGCLRALGAGVATGDEAATVTGVGGGFALPTGPVDVRESGSTLRFVIPLFGLLDAPVRLEGAQSLFRRPLDAYTEIFQKQGLRFAPDATGVTLQGPLRPGEYALRGDVSSQFISGLLFALPLLERDSVIRITPPLESRSYIELTRSAQQRYGVESVWEDAFTLRVPGGQLYRAMETTVEGDWSNGATLAVLAATCGGGFGITGLDPHSAQGDRAVLGILARCGAAVEWRENNTLHITPPAGGLAAPGDVDLADCPDLGPVLTALALRCKGQTRFVNAGRLRIKESDRIAAVEKEFARLGGQVASTQDSYSVTGPAALYTGSVDSHNDHRMVMATTIAAIAAGLPLTVTDAGAITKSWPGYFATLEKLGIGVHTL